jgi:hypothetical protein
MQEQQEQSTAGITSTHERIIEAKKRNMAYSVLSKPTFIERLNGWLVETKVIVHDNGFNREYESSSFRKILPDQIYTALETADTVSTGRALGKAGIGIEDGLPTSDEMDNKTPVTNEQKAVVEGVKEKPKTTRKKKVTTADGKEIEVDLTSGTVTHEKHCEAVMAAATGDMEHANKVVAQIKDEAKAIDISIPPLDDTTTPPKRNIRLGVVKELWDNLASIGATEETCAQWIAESEWEMPEGVDVSAARYDLLRYATPEEITNFIIYLKTQ